jgi:hypothetical protein
MAYLLKSNEFWGRRSGRIDPQKGPIIQQQQWGAGANNQKGQGKRLRRMQRSLYGSKEGPRMKA